MKFSFKNTTLKSKLVALYIVTAVLPVILVGVLSYSIYYRSIIDTTNSFVEQNSLQYEQLISDRLQACHELLFSMVINPRMVELAESLNTPDENNVAYHKSALRSMLESMTAGDRYLNGVAFISRSDNYTFYAQQFDTSAPLLWKRREWRQEVLAAADSDTVVYRPTEALFVENGKSYYSVFMCFPVRDLRQKTAEGVLVLAVDLSIFQPYNAYDDERTDVHTLIADEQGRMINARNTDYLKYSYEQVLEQISQELRSIRTTEMPVENTPWKIVSIIDQSSLYKQAGHLSKMVFLCILLITAIFFGFVYLIMRRYTKSIDDIATGIKAYAAGDKDVVVTLDEKDDFYTVAKQFNRMTMRINTLVEMLERKNIDIKNAVDCRRKAEIKALEAQINPHFLYNTLDSINWLAIEQEEYEISDMISSLGSILRYSVTNIDMLVTLRAEIEWLNKYIFLQRERFDNAFDFEIEVADDVWDLPVHKMLMQPLVENSILYAFEDMEGRGRIRLKVWRDAACLYIAISDNGKGIEPDKLERIKSEISNTVPLNSRNIGISNVVNRLEIYYRGRAALRVDSSPGRGTAFTMVIPLEKSEEGKNQ